MKIKVGYSMGYCGTTTEWEEEIPEDVVAEGQEAIEEYLEGTRDELFTAASEKISVWANIEE